MSSGCKRASGRRATVEAVEPRVFMSVTSLAPRQDAHVRAGAYAATNAGTSAALVVSNDGTPDGRRQAYLTFDTSTVAGAATRAVLRLYGSAAASTAVPLVVSGVPDAGWDESTLTYANRPASDGRTLAATAVGAAGRWHELDVTAYVTALREAGETTVSFALFATTSGTGPVTFSASEAATNEPALVLTTTAATPPAGPPSAPAIPAAVAQVTAAGGMKVSVSAGTAKRPDGSLVTVKAAAVTLAAPPVVGGTYDGPATVNYSSAWAGKRWTGDTIELLPPGTDGPIVGGLYRQVIPSSVVVTNGAGKTYVKDVDYKLNDEWGQIANIGGRLGSPGSGRVKITFKVVLQRLDLVQVRSDGTVAVKQGTAAVTVPALPAADAGAVGLAGVHVQVLDGARSSGFVVTTRDVYPIKPAAYALPANTYFIPRVVKKMQTGGSVNVAFLGDGITLGGEAGNWQSSRADAYTTKVLTGLRSRYPKASFRETIVAADARTVLDAEAAFKSKVLDAHAGGNTIDLLVIALGTHDAGKPSLDAFSAKLKDLIARARDARIEVMLVTPLRTNEFYESRQTDRVPRSAVAQAIRDVASGTGAPVADVYKDWVNQASRGVAPASQLHNGYDRPGKAGMKLYADAILRAVDACAVLEPADKAVVKGDPSDPKNWYIARHKKYLADLAAKKGDVDFVLLGDSITDFWRYAGSGPMKAWTSRFSVLNLGVGGDRTQNLIWRVENGQVAGIAPKVAMVLIGSNNFQTHTDAQIAAGIAAVVRTARRLMPGTKVLLLGLFPTGGRTSPNRTHIANVNRMLSGLDDGANVAYMDVGSKILLDAAGNLRPDRMHDGSHPSASGYQAWVDAVQPQLTEWGL